MGSQMGWLQECLNQHQNITNYSMQECVDIFGRTNIHLPSYILAVTGKKNNIENKYIAFIQIISSTNAERPLHGSHDIWIYVYVRNKCKFEKVKLTIYSLSYLRQHILQFTDHLSFERSTFVIVPQRKKIVRLKCIRSILQFGNHSPPNNHFSLSSCRSIDTNHNTPPIS